MLSMYGQPSLQSHCSEKDGKIGGSIRARGAASSRPRLCLAAKFYLDFKGTIRVAYSVAHVLSAKTVRPVKVQP